MRHVTFRVLFFSILLFILPAVAGAGPWVQDKGRVQVALTVAYSCFDSYLNSSGDAIDLNDDIHQYEIFYYYNIGLGDRRDISVLAGFVDSDSRDPVQGVSMNRNRGLVDTAVRYKAQIYSKHTSVALIAGLRVPGTYNEDVLNSVGDRSLDLEAGLSVGEYYKERSMYWSADVIYRIRFGDTDDEAELGLEFGRVFHERWLFRGLASWINQVDGYDIDLTALGTNSGVSFSQLEEDRYRYGAGVTYQFGSQSSIGITYLETYGGSNTKKDRTFYLTYGVQNR